MRLPRLGLLATCAAALLLPAIVNGQSFLPGVGGAPVASALNNTGLKALPGMADAVVYRRGFTTAGDGGGAWYAWNSSACTLHSGAGDNGAEVAPNSGGGCWKLLAGAQGADARVWGVFASATDNSTALADAATWSCTAGKAVFVPAGSYNVAATITIGNGTSSSISTLNGCALRAIGVGLARNEAVPAASPVTILWTGAANGTVFKVAGPISAVHLGGIKVDCDNICTTGFDFETPVSSTFHDLLVERYVNGPAYILNSTPTFAGFSTGTQHSTLTNVRAENPGSCGSGIVIGPSTDPGGVDDPAQNTYTNNQYAYDGTCATAYGIKLQFTDNQTFIESSTGPQGGTSGHGIIISPPSGNTGFPGETVFINSAIVGGVFVNGTWTAAHGIGFFPYPVTDGEPVPSSSTQGQLYGFLSDGTPFGGLTSSTLQFDSGSTTLTLAGSTYNIGSGCARTDGACQLLMPYSGWLRDLYVIQNVAPGASQTVAVTIYKNLAAATITCTITDPANSCGDLTHTIQVSAGDIVTLQAVGSAGAASAVLIGTLEYDR